MTEHLVKGLTVADTFGQKHEFATVLGSGVKIEHSMLTAEMGDGLFCHHLDMMRYFQVEVEPDHQELRYASCEVRLSAADGAGTETVRINDIINYSWNANTGILMIYGRNSIAGFHFDHVTSFHLAAS